MCLLRLDSVHAYYGYAHVLHGISFEVKEHQVVSLLGRNGMGKTATLQTIMGLTRVPVGSIRFRKIDLRAKTTDEIARLGIGYVPEDRRIFTSMSVKENLLVSHLSHDVGLRSKLEEIFSLFPVLSSKLASRGDQLSGGEQQMLAIARALMNNPKLVLLDEPCEGLAPIIVRELEKSVKNLLKKGVTILLAEQSVRMSKNISNLCIVLTRGSVCHSGDINLLMADALKMKEYLGVDDKSRH